MRDQARILSDDLDALEELRAEGNNAAALAEMYREWESQMRALVRALALVGPHDRCAALVTVRAGAGGADARDWAAQLTSMYIAWAGRAGRRCALLDERHGEGGLRSATLRIGGPHAHGLLRGESGVHRVSHLSRFGAQGKRQTSFAAVEVIPQIPAGKRALDLGAVRIDTYRASGPGGQHRNTTDSAVRATHEPSGICAHASGERSQHANRAAALTLLAARVAAHEDAERDAQLRAQRSEAPSPAFGGRRRSYVLHPYTAVSDHDGRYRARNAGILTGDLAPALDADLLRRISAPTE